MKTFIVRHTIVIEQEVIARSRKDAEDKYNDTIEDNESRLILTQDGATSSSSTTSEIEVLTPSELDEEQG